MKNLDSILPISDEGLYPIRTVSELVGVNSITLRAWERRYNLFKPKRSPKGHRLYSEKDIQRIKQVTAFLATGVSIGRIAKVLKENNSEGKQLVNDIPSSNYSSLNDEQSTNYQIELLKIISTFDVLKLETFHHDLFTKYPIETVIKALIVPVLTKLSDNAKSSSLSCEYKFYKSFILFRLGGLCLKTSINNTDNKLILLSIEQEHCEVEMLLFALPLLQHGFQLVTLGCNVILDSIPMCLLKSKAKGVIILSGLNLSNLDTKKELTTLLTKVNKPVFVNGQLSKIDEKSLKSIGAIILPSSSDTQTALINKNIDKSA